MRRLTLRKRVAPVVVPLTREEKAARLLMALSIVAIPLVFDPVAKDTFRTPKELLLRAIAIIIGAVIAFYATRPSAARRLVSETPRPLVILPLAIIGWTVLTTFTSTARMLSMESLVTVACSVLFFFGALFAFRRNPSVHVLDVVFIAPVINALLAIAQEYGIWQPFRFPKEGQGHIATTALLGNPNDVGTFLVIPAIAAIVGARVFVGKRRAAYLVIGAILVAGIIASGTRTAIIAFGASLIAAALASRSWTSLLLAAVAAVAITFAFSYSRLDRDFQQFWRAALERRYDVVFSERLPAFLTAMDMLQDHPLTGVGPGGYKFNYMRYRLALNGQYPAAWTRGWPMNFAETHNDHLQILAETGITGYLLFAAAIAAMLVPFYRSRSNGDGGTPRSHFARAFAVPFVIGVVVLMIAQFPLQLAAPRAMFLYFAGLCSNWSLR